MKHIATVPAALVKAAMFFQAKQEIRHYLNGVMLDNNGAICATNGHIMFVAPCEQVKSLSGQMIISIHGTIPAPAHELEIYLDDDSRFGFIRLISGIAGAPLMTSEGHVKRMFFDVIDGKIPDYQRAIPKGDLEPVDTIGLNFDYADRVAKASKALGAKYPAANMRFRGKTGSIEVDIPSPFHDGVKAIIMPCRI